MSYQDDQNPQDEDQAPAEAEAPAEETPAEAPAEEAAPATPAGGEDGDSLSCEECGAGFVFTTGEKEFYAEKGFTPPKRCPDCRQKKKEARRTETTVTCAGCNTETTVPFVPSGDRPVYCRDCFDKQRAG